MLAVEGDISEPATTDRLTVKHSNAPGESTPFINNVGVCIAKPFTDYTAADYPLMTSVNLTGFWLTRRAITGMLGRGSGHIVNISAAVAENANSAPSAPAALTKGCPAAATRSRP